MEALIIPLALLFFLVSALLVLSAPVALVVMGYRLLRRRGIGSKPAIVYITAPVLVLLAWPLSGLYELNQQCGHTALSRSNPDKLGPIDALLIEGPGMWWLDGRIDVEQPEYILKSKGLFVGAEREKTDMFLRKEANPAKVKTAATRLPENNLRSHYKVTIKQPEVTSYLERYITSAPIVIEERATGRIVASFTESAWGGGLAGNFVAAFSKLNPFYNGNRFLSCGYTEQRVGVFRERSRKRDEFYENADKRLIEDIFILSTAKDVTK